MPDTLVERAARYFIADARDYTVANNPVSRHPDGAILGPLVVAYAHAAADLMEYLVDVDGGIEGIAEFRAILHAHEGLLPRSPYGERCECVICDPTSPNAYTYRATDAVRHHAQAQALRDVGLPSPAQGFPVPARRPEAPPTSPLTIVA